MSRQVSSLKGLVATSCKKLETILARYKEDRLETMKVEEGDGSSEDQRACRMRIQEALGAMQECTTRIDHLLERYASAYDQLERPTKSATNEYEEYSTKAADILSEALDYTIILQGRLRTFTSNTGRGQRMPNAGELEQLSQDLIPQTKRIDLPTLPIPSFSGNVWDWDNFWILFSTNVHSQPLPEIFKFNYLLNALKGEAYNAVKKFQITNENNQKAIEFLQAKYGNKEELVQRLIVKMETTTMRSTSVKDQRVLLEQMQAIVSQLRDKGETVNSPWLVKQVLSKFPERLQRKALKRKRSMGGSFQMEDLLASLDDSISEEEMISLFPSKNNVMQQQNSQKGKPHKEQTSRGSLSCMYCGEDHKASSCTRYGTPQERANYLREHKLCLICASPQHATSDCKKRPCFACQGKHHTSCCFKAMTTPETSTPRQGKPTASAKPNERLKFAKNTNPTSAATHQLSNQEEDHISSRTNAQEDSVTQLHSSEGRPSTRETYLPIGELTIMDPSSRELRKVTTLLDSGAECSFIDHKLAEELRLPTLGTTTLRVRTFGSDRVQECVSRKVPLEMWDHEGKPWSLELLTHETLTSTLRTPPVLEEDVAFIKSQNINVNLVEAQEAIKPLILLGSDQLWQLIRHDEAHICLDCTYYPHVLGTCLPLPGDRKWQWEAIASDMHGFQKSLPRFLLPESSKAVLVVCADASSEAFAACAYLCSSSSANLIMAKGRVPSLKSKMTVPKMELSALQMAVRLSNSIVSQISSSVTLERVLILSDSEIALNWIRVKRPDAGPFVRNRVFEVHSIVNQLEESGYVVESGYVDGHIASYENPADCATRGLDKWQLHGHFWWTGPRFLTEPAEQWKCAFIPIALQKDDGQTNESQDTAADGPQNTAVLAQSRQHYADIFYEIRSANLRTVQRVVAFVLRFIKLLVARVNERGTLPIQLSQLLNEVSQANTPFPSGKEVRTACKAIVKQHQLSWMTPTILKSLRRLQPYVDEQGILRCRGRLGKSALDEHAKFPTLVLQKTWLSRLIVIDCHRELHTSISHTMCRVRERYWIPKLRAEVTRIIGRCTECQKMNNLPYKYPDQGHLPARRVTRSRPFEHIGLDYFGPLSVKGEGGPEKCYGCIITCLVTRLVHLDLTLSQSSGTSSVPDEVTCGTGHRQFKQNHGAVLAAMAVTIFNVCAREA